MPKNTTKKETKPKSKATTKAKSTSKASTKSTSAKNSTKAKNTPKNTKVETKTPTTKKVKPNYKLISIVVLVGLLVTFLFMLRSQLIVATVNGTPITRYSLIKELEKQGGKQVLEGLVIQKIIDQEANKKGVKVTDQDIDAEIDKIRGQIPQGMTLEQMLELQGGDIQTLRTQLVLQIKLRKILEDQVTVTDEEVNAEYEANKESYANISEQEAKAQIKEGLEQQKLSGLINTWIEQKKSEADVKYYMFVVKPEPQEQVQPQIEEQPVETTQDSVDQEPTELPSAE